jgi:hypothetical protein
VAEVTVMSVAEVEGSGGSASGVKEIGGGASGCEDGEEEAVGTKPDIRHEKR